jgi:hypothetical protein
MSIRLAGFLTTSVIGIFSNTGGSETAILSINFCNITTSQRKITLYCLGPTSPDDEKIIAIIYLNGENSFSWSGDEKLLLDTDDVIAAKADANSAVTATVCYKVIG